MHPPLLLPKVEVSTVPPLARYAPAPIAPQLTKQPTPLPFASSAGSPNVEPDTAATPSAKNPPPEPKQYALQPAKFARNVESTTCAPPSDTSAAPRPIPTAKPPPTQVQNCDPSPLSVASTAPLIGSCCTLKPSESTLTPPAELPLNAEVETSAPAQA